MQATNNIKDICDTQLNVSGTSIVQTRAKMYKCQSGE